MARIASNIQHRMWCPVFLVHGVVVLVHHVVGHSVVGHAMAGERSKLISVWGLRYFKLSELFCNFKL